MARALTSKAVEAMKSDPTRRLEIADPALSGLYLVIQPSGAKSWALRYRWAGKSAKLTLGKWPLLGVADARAAASEAIDKVDHGRDPSADKKATKAARLDAQLSERDKVKTLVDQYDQRHLIGLKSGRTVRRELDRHVLAVWGDRDIHEIQRRDVIDLLDGIADSGRIVTANRVRAYLNTFFAWCVERDILAGSPATGVKPVAKEISRDRVLSDTEIRWFWEACENAGQPWGPLGKLLLLTGQRLSEIAGMTDSEIYDATLHLGALRTKNGRAHDVPLSKAAMDVLSSMVQIEGQAGLYHTTNGETPLSGFHKGRNRLADGMRAIAREDAGEPTEIPHWTFHDLRRTAATGMARLGIPVRVTEAVLNHASGTGGGIVAVYQRHDYANEKRNALDAWSQFVLALVGSAEDSLVIQKVRG
ncbi:Site-specific recombinase XerD [Loktanella sp. DSM 29012]|uniref:Integrase arm-type DNA-binding domain-containing protein n=1 Tax=Loktanella gaetbuli TaxID=2881335 RepID=A0ABS8BWX4_9RHOB|nr:MULTISPECIES: site-specific integrase [Loktanella]MCB5200243.1 integrase arm-type DNA-binding domain-containing protein [Loktanella gaetbuli]SEP82652.1 Site-specific recombinase XerD [Loktanella sp. DSM 29012]